jgi:murein L,D-transpeptidase YcbB/YkuD
VVNPWWSLPASIVKEKGLSAGRRGGFVYTGNGFRQAPGPNNALGRVKIDMPNEHAIYLHDTPAKAKFAEASRGFSHGCIRVKGIDALAEQLMQMSAGDDSAVTEALGTTRTATLKMPQSLPVYIVYFTTEVDASGRLVNHEDPYGRDAQVLAALGGAAAPTQLAMK